MLAATEAAVSNDEDRWHDALRIAAEHGLRLIIVDALEGLAAAAARSESWAECLRLYGAAQRLRAECEYRWRFGLEEQVLDVAITAARQQLDSAQAVRAEAEGRALPWADAVGYARRARGDRKRPRHGWASLTPTEEHVVALVAEGLTNPEIATRLLMGRSTVKTHLEHIFAKLGVTSRSDLASQAARRPVKLWLGACRRSTQNGVIFMAGRCRVTSLMEGFASGRLPLRVTRRPGTQTSAGKETPAVLPLYRSGRQSEARRAKP